MPLSFPTVHFPGPGVEIFPLWPVLLMLVVSMFTSTAGVSGAFLLMPFQVSVLGYTGLGVTPTNHLFNVVAIPSGVYRYVREGRMVWPLTFITLVATIPGVLLGSHVRMRSLADPVSFKLFMGLVLLAIGSRMVFKLGLPARGYFIPGRDGVGVRRRGIVPCRRRRRRRATGSGCGG